MNKSDWVKKAVEGDPTTILKSAWGFCHSPHCYVFIAQKFWDSY